MANVTFSNSIHKDKTVYAVAGSHTKTLLSLAQENKIPIEFDCENGECGSCLIKVKLLDEAGKEAAQKTPMGMHLTMKERTVLKDLGKLTQEQIDDLVTHDRPSEWRLACQFIVRDEDILVEY
ncbi:MAG: 2Fe-2S iron-sulfur cluster-binding protein [Pseudomonadota bacterium]